MTSPSDQARRDRDQRTKGTAAGIVALSATSLTWVGGWHLFTGGVPTAAIVWWLVAWLALGLLGMPRGK